MVLIGLLVLAGYLVVTYIHASSCSVSSELVNSCRPWIGAAATGNPGAASANIAQFDYLEQLIGRPMDIYRDYHSSPGSNSLDTLPFDQTTTAGQNEVHFADRANTYVDINWKPTDTWAEADGSDSSGNALINQTAANIKAIPHKIFMSIWWEPENDVSAFDNSAEQTACQNSPKYTHLVGAAGTPAQYVGMWQNVEKLFAQDGVTNVVWMMDYQSYPAWDCLIDPLWPGNSLVDWVVYDTYDHDDNVGTTFDTTAGTFYNVLSADSNATDDFDSKPWGLGEFGTCGNPSASNTQQYYVDAKNDFVAGKYPRLKMYLVYADTGNDSGPACLTNYDLSGGVDSQKQADFNALDTALVGGNSTPTPVPPTPTPTRSATPKPTPAPSPAASATPGPVGTPGPGVGGGSGSDGAGGTSGTVSLGASGSSSVITVDGKTVSDDGQLNTTYLTNGKHTVTVDKDGKTTKETITVNNRLDPYDMFRNYVFAAFVGHPAVMNVGAVVVLLILLGAIGVLLLPWVRSWLPDLITRMRVGLK